MDERNGKQGKLMTKIDQEIKNLYASVLLLGEYLCDDGCLYFDNDKFETNFNVVRIYSGSPHKMLLKYGIPQDKK